MKYLIVFALILPACEDRTSASRALDSMGMTNVQWEGYDWAACAEVMARQGQVCGLQVRHGGHLLPSECEVPQGHGHAGW